MKYFVSANEDGRVSALSEGELADGMQMELPDGFDFENIADYRLIDGALVHDPVPTQTPMTLDDVLEYATDIDMRLMERELGM